MESDLKYTLRFPSASRVNQTDPVIYNWQTNLLFPLFSGGGPNENDSDYGGVPFYYQDAFLAIQDRMNYVFVDTTFDRAVEKDKACKEYDVPEEKFIPQVLMQRFPYPPYEYDLLQSAMQMLAGLFIMLGFIYTMMRMIQFIAVEQEKELKDVMAIMGMPFYLHILCWFFHIMILMIISITLVVGILKVIHNGNYVLNQI